MNIDLRKKKAQQAQTQLTISIWIRWAITTAAILAAIVAAVSALGGYHSVDRIASVIVVLLLVAEVVVYGFGHVNELLKQRNSYTQKISEIEDGQCASEATLLEMPVSYPHVEAFANHVNRLRWANKPWPLLADLLTFLFVAIMLSIFATLILGGALLVNYWVIHHNRE